MRSLALLVTACGAGAMPLPLANHAQVARADCSEPIVDRLAAMLRARWHTGPLELRCAAGRFGVDGFFLEARAGELRRTGIVDASGAELVAFTDEPELAPQTFINGYRTADLDGDGRDEIIESWRRSEHAKLGADNWLVVRRVFAHRLGARIQGPYVSRYHPDLGGCSATWEVRTGAILVAVEVDPGIPPSDCLPAGTHRFALRGHVLSERSGRRE
jgi:hypothetical protein